MLQAPLPVPPPPPSPEAVIISSGGGPSVLEAIAICVMAISFSFIAYKLLMPLVRAFAARIEGRGSNPALEQRVNELQSQLADAEILHGRVADLTSRDVTGWHVVVSGGEVTTGPVGGVPVAVALLFTSPASTSACVIVCVPVQVVFWPGASVVTGHTAAASSWASFTTRPVIVTLPVFVTRNV